MVKFIFRCDGGNVSEIGTGHVSRCIYVADYLVLKKKAKISDIKFICKSEGPYKDGYNILKETKYKTIRINNEIRNNSKKEAEIINKLTYDVLIIDRLKNTKSFISYINKINKKIVSFDDVGLGSTKVNLAINGILGKKYNRSHILDGYQYIIINPVLKKEIRKSQKNVKNIFVSFGGYDKRNLNLFFLDSLEKNLTLLNKKINITLFIGNPSNRIENKIDNYRNKLNKNFNINIRYFKFNKKFYSLIKKSDLFISAGGITVFHLIFLGIPLIALPQYKHQLKTLKKLEKKNSLIIGSKSMKLDEMYFRRKFNDLINFSSYRDKIKSNARQIIDGKGIERIVNEMQLRNLF
jgi:spore coat polysaccharide biosynthesis predicted glycosyltransferase SpsG